MQADIKTIEINGVEYAPADSIKVKEFDGDIQITEGGEYYICKNCGSKDYYEDPEINYSYCPTCGVNIHKSKREQPKPTLPDVPKKFEVYFTEEYGNKKFEIAINDLIDCYSALKKVVEEKL